MREGIVAVTGREHSPVVHKLIFLLKSHLFQSWRFSSLHKSEIPCIISPQLPLHFELQATANSLQLSRILSFFPISIHFLSSLISQSCLSHLHWYMTRFPPRRGLWEHLGASQDFTLSIHIPGSPACFLGKAPGAAASTSLGLDAAGVIEAEECPPHRWQGENTSLTAHSSNLSLRHEVFRLPSFSNCLGRIHSMS